MCYMGEVSSKQVAVALLDKYNIFIKDLSEKEGFEGKSYIRVAVRNRFDNQKLIDGLTSVLRRG